jgi:hypothetical protein
MKSRLLVLLTLGVLLMCFAAPAVAHAEGVFVYWGEGGVGPATAAGQYWDLTLQTGQAPFVTYGSTLPPDLSTYRVVILSQNASFSPASTLAIRTSVLGGGVVRAVGDHAAGNPPFVSAMNNLSLQIGAAPLFLAAVEIDPSWHVTTHIDPHPLTTGVTTVGYSGSSAVLMPDPSWSLVREDGGVESILGMAQLGPGWFILCADSNMFSDQGRIDFGVDVLQLYDNSRIIANAIWGPPPPMGQLFGNVTDATTGLPIPFAPMQVGTDPPFTTDEGGFFGVGLSPGDYTVTCFPPGYVTQSASVTIVDGVTTTRDFALTPEPPDVAPSDTSYTDPATGVTVTFENVASAGDVAITALAPGHEAPANWRFLGNSCYDISTTAGYTGWVEVKLPVPADYHGDGNSLQVFHWDQVPPGSAVYDWADCTVRYSYDPMTRTIKGKGYSLSPFVLAEPVGGPVVSTPASSTLSLSILALGGLGIALAARRRFASC